MENQNQGSGERGWRKAGSLIPPIPRSPSTEVLTSSKSSALQTASAPTAPTKGPPARIGPPAGACGSSVTLISTDLQELAAKSTPDLMAMVTASLPQRLVLSPVWLPTEAEWKIPLGYTVAGTEADRATARALLSSTMTPLSPEKMAEELTKLNAKTKIKKEDEVDLEIRVAAYVEELAQYPGEAVIWALRRWSETKDGTFWPAWKGLYELLEARVAERMLMLEALWE